MATISVEKRDEYSLGFAETELRLGLPGDGESTRGSGKRGFSEMVDLELRFQMADTVKVEAEKVKISTSVNDILPRREDPAEKPPPAKAQVVGWPPVRSFRKNALSSRYDKGMKEEGVKQVNSTSFVKVSIDGAPYLRKVDMKIYKSYQELSIELDKMFNSFTIGTYDSQRTNERDSMNESNLMDLLHNSQYVPTYEDRDGDWMLVGDVPWEMFVDSCKRLRITKGSAAIGLAPRPTKKCK